ncbi:MAG: hypothetical protein C6W57_02450 [Caldibacillus debilis]|nr:hypothetical protein [Bacillaceae bacterium]REJ18949.1 MAG: hypothetical protein C6W57_02450 [Caldibacillus debilis]
MFLLRERLKGQDRPADAETVPFPGPGRSGVSQRNKTQMIPRRVSQKWILGHFLLSRFLIK